MSARLSDHSGQITVMLSLLFFLMLGVGCLVSGGMREYAKASLAEEAMDLAGEDVLAQYDRPLFERYHIFLMDPREESAIVSDGKTSVESLFASNGLFRQIDVDITLESDKKALDDDGKALLRQIKEWETGQGIRKVPDVLKHLLKSAEQNSAEDALSDVEEDNKEEPAEPESPVPTETEEERKVKKTWKEWKELLNSILDSGILLYAVDDQGTISSLRMPATSDLPSGTHWKDRMSFSMEGFSLTGLSRLKKLCREGTNPEPDDSLLTSDAYLIPYIFDCFNHYKDQDTKKEHRLKYEIEYLLGGKTKDKDNLKYVADQMFLMRFLVNFGYAAKDSGIRKEAETMALVLTGLFGFPQGEEAVAMLLIASLCYGESLMEIRALFSGEKVALVKTKSNWNLSFSNAVSKLGNRSDIIKVKDGVNYQQYLAGLLVMRSKSRKLLYRMLDIMQSNVTLEEPDFLIKHCVTSFTWSGKCSWKPFYRKITAFGLTNEGDYSMEIRRTVAYR